MDKEALCCKIMRQGASCFKGNIFMKQLVKNILSCVCLVLLCAILTPSARVRASEKVVFEIGSARGSVGDEITIPISIQNSSEVASMDLTVVYDPDELDFVGVTKGEAVADGNICDINHVAEKSYIRFVFSSLQEIPEDGQIMVLTFSVVKDEPKEHTVDLDVKGVLNMDIEDLAWKTEGGREIAPSENVSQSGASTRGTGSDVQNTSGNADDSETVQSVEGQNSTSSKSGQISEDASDATPNSGSSERRFIVKTEDGIKDVTDTAGRETGENLLTDENKNSSVTDRTPVIVTIVAGVVIVLLIMGVIVYRVRRKK